MANFLFRDKTFEGPTRPFVIVSPQPDSREGLSFLYRIKAV